MPASLPECRSTRKMRMTAMKTWRTASTECIGPQGSRSRLVQRVEPAQDLDRLAPQRPVHRPPVGVGELARAVVELGVADLAVLRLPGGLQLGALRRLGGLARLPVPRTERRR